MTENNQPFSQAEFDDIYSKVPRLTVEVIVKDVGNRIYLTQRAIEPCKFKWHLPGGTVRFGEPLQKAVQRIANRELGINVKESAHVGVIEYPSHYKNNLDDPIGIVFEVKAFEGNFTTNNEAMDSGWFTELPENFHADQDKFLIENNYLVA